MISAMPLQSVAPSLSAVYPAEQHRMLMSGLMMYPDYDEGKSSVHDCKDKVKPKGQTKRKSTSTKGNARKKVEHEAASVEMVVADGSSKKRGRPRVDCADQTAAERRRTQIRLAQRAYRMRKETAISSLTQRVTELEANMQEMREAFLAFNDEAMRTGALSSYPRLAQQLLTTAKRVMSLAPDSSDSDQSPEEISRPIELVPEYSTVEVENCRQLSPNGSFDTRFSDVSYQDANPVFYFGRAPLVLNHDSNSFCPNTVSPDVTEIYDAPKVDAISTSMDIPATSVVCSTGADVANCAVPSLHSTGAYLFNGDMDTYCYQESNYARRLHRRSLEFAYELLTSPGTRPERLARKFRLTFYMTMRSHLVDSVSALLHKRANEPLEFMENPLFCVGRAGTHFPRVDDLGNKIFPPNMQSLDQVFEALRFPSGEGKRFRNVEEFIEKMGFSGEWFDCHDVEGYLKSKGIHIETRSTFVQVPPSIAMALSRPSVTSPYPAYANSQHNAQIPTSTPGGSYQLSATAGPYASHSMQYLASNSQTLFPRSSIEQLVSSNAPTSTMPQTLIMDLDKFTAELARNSTCLGRAPGFKKRDVDAAIMSSICSGL